jgi:hypothetical protein
VHYLELDQFIGEDYLVTVHGPISSKAPLEAALRETEAVKARRTAAGCVLPRRSDLATQSSPRSHDANRTWSTRSPGRSALWSSGSWLMWMKIRRSS